MMQVWIKQSEGKWVPGVLVSSAPHGAGDGWLMVGYDDNPHVNWGYPAGSMAIVSVSRSDVRLRRTVIPVIPHDGEK